MVDKDVEKKCLAHRHVDTTISRMELSGILICLKTIVDNAKFFSSKPIVYIVSDSEYATLGVAERMVKWKKAGWTNSTGKVLNLDLWEIVYNYHSQIAKLGINVQIVWVKGHSNHKWNNRVDGLADYKTPLEHLNLNK